MHSEYLSTNNGSCFRKMPRDKGNMKNVSKITSFITLFLFSLLTELGAHFNECGSGPSACYAEVRIRSYDGSCNNLKNPRWGSAKGLYGRVLPAQYHDGISSYRRAQNGNPLPNARFISSHLYKDKYSVDSNITRNAAQFGQLFAHDLGDRYVDFQIQMSCCTEYLSYVPGSDLSTCTDIPIPANDPIYSKYKGVECLQFRRTQTNLFNNCSLDIKSAQQQNHYTAYIDLHPVYGISDEENRKLRTMKNGQLRVSHLNDQDWFPNSTNPELDCFPMSRTKYCFKAGDSRVNQNPHLAVLNVYMLREHNRIAKKLAKLNPHWDDETVFQNTRTIMIGVFQHITFVELLPVFVGENVLYENEILYTTEGFVDEYDETVNPAPFNEFSQAAFRQGHSLVAGKLDFVSEKRNFVGAIDLQDSFYNVSILQERDNFDMLTRGLCTDPSWGPDVYHDDALTHLLFKDELDVGMDLKTIDIQRSRDHGVASYNDYRVLCNLKRAKSFADFKDVIKPKFTKLLEKIYTHPDDVDFIVGGNLEKVIPGTLAGPTLTCIWLKQFKNIRRGDRYFYDHRDGPFNLDQLNEIRKASVSKWFCDNSKSIKHMQPKGFLSISATNPLLPCEKIPEIDLTKWKESCENQTSRRSRKPK